MRTSFIQTLCELAEEDPRIWLLCGDLGYSVLEPFAACFPKRYVNVGIAEQNMTGMAAGLAMSGKTVFTYSIANFPVMRCLEQIRNDVCYHNLNVNIVAVGGGLSYGSQGYTHHGVEDLAVLRVLPNMTVIAPADPMETRQATRAVAKSSGPCYLRLGKAGEPTAYASEPEFEIGKAIVARAGDDVTLISTGGMLITVLKAADMLAERGVSAEVLSMHTVQPLDEDIVLNRAQSHGRIVTVEEHGLGGLGSAVAETLAVSGAGAKLRILRLARAAFSLAGSQTSLREGQGLSAQNIADTASLLL